MSYTKQKPDTALLESELRELSCWYEWSSIPSHQVVAQVLQDAADAMRVRALSPEAAKALITVWQPFVGREAAIGNPPRMVRLEDNTIGALQYAVKDLRRMLDEAAQDRKPRLAELLREQVKILEGEKMGKPWKAAS